MNEKYFKFPYPEVTRVEVIDSSGRAYTCYDAKDVEISTQDNGRTIKVFLKNNRKPCA